MESQVNKVNLSLRIFKFFITLFLAVIIYKALLTPILTKKLSIMFYLFFWLVISYFVLPILTRLITKLYLPNYYIGRTKTSDGLLGDPINLAFYGTRENIIKAFEASGWHVADDLDIKSSFKIALASVLAKSYPTAPVSSLFLFSNKQDLAFEREIHGNPRKRHHIRLWKTPEDWYLPGGFKADWLAAATYDRNVGLSLFTLQITHKIDANIDKERDFVIDSLNTEKTIENVNVIKHFTNSYHGRNGGGDKIFTDGSLPFVTVKRNV